MRCRTQSPEAGMPIPRISAAPPAATSSGPAGSADSACRWARS